ncbi:hypothetical protein NAP1_14503 [Erythrobacter sp. NAP1]|uniref:hypothetical protein n=1 Tax=Erythrobacter sp. NAP1 TaxID=237727 RepID=UPI000068780C|nr:hypothetical protein [Erythrobacter sp. NAP1]EAQ28818.1 hypothetical protein NAP1_14503 [Erythrobacter sp. NAP1]
MPLQIWVGIGGTLVALAFVANGIRHIRRGEGHLANAGRLHIAMATLFIPVLWLIVIFQVMSA